VVPESLICNLNLKLLRGKDSEKTNRKYRQPSEGSIKYSTLKGTYIGMTNKGHPIKLFFKQIMQKYIIGCMESSAHFSCNIEN
jgi:hypothetical protein